MFKYSFEFKKKVVTTYSNGGGGYAHLSKVYGVPSPSNIEIWIHNYQTFGDRGLIRSRKKFHVVELFLSSEVSYQELALKE